MRLANCKFFYRNLLWLKPAFLEPARANSPCGEQVSIHFFSFK